MTLNLLGKNHLAVARRRAGLTVDQLSEMTNASQLALLQLESEPGDPFKGDPYAWAYFARFGMVRPTDDDPPAETGAHKETETP